MCLLLLLYTPVRCSAAILHSVDTDTCETFEKCVLYDENCSRTCSQAMLRELQVHALLCCSEALYEHLVRNIAVTQVIIVLSFDI